jgi:hypothetical protein
MNRPSAFTFVALAALALGCAPSFDPPSEIQSLRVLAVKKDLPYAPPGEQVTLNMLWHDAEAAQGRDVQRAWIGGCFNPPGDLYQGCLSAISADPSGVILELPADDEFTVTIPNDIVRIRPQGQYNYGISYVFFAVCAGTIELATEQEGLPIRCVDASGQVLGADDFVVGYTAIYSFDQIVNQNPIVTGFQFSGEDVTPDCIGLDCINAPIVAATDCEAPGAACVPACADDGEPECQEYLVKPVVSEDSAEVDEVSAVTYGADFEEQLWINYYVDHGSIEPAAKLVNDATKGWNPEQQGEFRAPSASGPAAVWAVVHDNRGGVEFVRFTITVQ